MIRNFLYCIETTEGLCHYLNHGTFHLWPVHPVPDQQCPNIKSSRTLLISEVTATCIFALFISNKLVDLALDALPSFDIFYVEDSLFQHLLLQRQLEQVVKSVASDDTRSVLGIGLVYACIF